MKTFLHYFHHYKLATSLNLFGIAVTLAGLFVLGCYIDYNRSYNKCFPEYETLYRLDVKIQGNWITTMPLPLLPYIEKCPQIEDFTALNWLEHSDLDNEGTVINVPIIKETGNALSFFGAKRVDGVLETMRDGNSMVLPASLAMTIFGDKHVAGRQLKWVNGETSTVAGVYEDFPDNCSIKNVIYGNIGNAYPGNPSTFSFHYYFRSKENPERLKDIITDMVRQYMVGLYGGEENMSENDKAMLADMPAVPMPLDEVYYSDHGFSEETGNRHALYMQEFAAILLLIICIINFTNFSIGQAPMRIRSALTCRVLGESLWRLRLGLLAEGAFVGVLAYVIAMVMVYVAGDVPRIAELLTVDIDIAKHPALLLFMLGGSICIGVVSVIYSTHYITSFPMVCVMKGNVGLSPQGTKVRTWLVGLQICISLIMAIFIGTMYSQSHFIFTSEYGYAKDSILIEDMSKAHQYSCSKEALRMELEKLPCVSSVSFSLYRFGTQDSYMPQGRGRGDRYYSFQTLPVDWKFLHTYGIDIVEGSNFSEHDGIPTYIINEAMKRAYPEMEVGKPLVDGEPVLIGICKDVRAFSTREDNSQIPLAFINCIQKDGEFTPYPCENLCIRLAPGMNGKPALV